MDMQAGLTKYYCFPCNNILRANMVVPQLNTRINVNGHKGLHMSQEQAVSCLSLWLIPKRSYHHSTWKIFVKAMGKNNSQGFQQLYKKFPKVSGEKLKEGIFVGP